MNALDRDGTGPGNIVPSAPGSQGVGEPIPPDEWAARVELAIAYRLLHQFGLTDLIHTHISAQVPGQPEQFLLLPYGHLFGEARASQMVKVDPNGGILSDPSGLGISRGGFCIHSALHLARADAVCVMHAHSEATIAVANYRRGLLPLSQHALRFHGRIAYLEYCGGFDTAEKRARLPAALGDGHTLMLRNHGPLVVGRTVREAFSLLYYLERACRMQVASLSQCRDADSELVFVDEAECAAMATAFQGGESVIDREWTALVRMLQHTAPGFDT
ncbi:MAG: class II aldolase/adducin family protein [Croceibacterium sp.]